MTDENKPQLPEPAASNQQIDETRPVVAAVYARLPVPPVPSSNIEAWFTTMDFWFVACGITAEKQKVATVIAALDPNVVCQLCDVIAAIPVMNKFEYIREKIIEHFADSEQRRLNRLLSDMPLGDKKPSELYYEMKRVAGTTMAESALKSFGPQILSIVC